MSLLQTTVGDRIAYVPCALPRSWAPARLLKAAQMWPHHPGEGCRTSGTPSRDHKSLRRGGSQLRCAAGLPHLSWQRRGEGRMFLGKRSWKSQKVKEEGKRGGQAVLPPSWAWKASHLQQTVVTRVLGLAAHFLFTSGAWSPRVAALRAPFPCHTWALAWGFQTLSAPPGPWREGADSAAGGWREEVRRWAVAGRR